MDRLETMDGLENDMNETSWALLAGLIVIGVGGVFTGTERVAQQEAEHLNTVAREMTASLAQVTVNREELEQWSKSSLAVNDPNWTPPRIIEIPFGDWGNGRTIVKELELAQRRGILRLNHRMKELKELIVAVKSTAAIRASFGSEAKKTFMAAEQYCMLELQRRKVEVPQHEDNEVVRKQLSKYMQGGRISRISESGYNAAESIVQEGQIPEIVKTESLLTWLSNVRAAQGVLEDLEASTDENMSRFDVAKATREEVMQILDLHVRYEQLLGGARDDILGLSWRFQFVVVGVWVNWVLGLFYGGIVVFGIGSLFARRAKVLWRWKGIGFVPVVIGAAIATFCFIDHPPKAEEPGLTCIWVGVYGGFVVGFTAMLMMLCFPALMKAIQKRQFR
jgi:hypothetical protein